MRKRFALKTVTAVALLALAGCGGGGGSDDGESGGNGSNEGRQTMVPDSAVASADSFAAFIASLRPSDSGQPLAMNGREPPTSDSDSPIDFD